LSIPKSAELYDITGFSLLDFPDTPAAIFWFAGCNLRCDYCYNPHIVYGPGKITLTESLAFLEKRRGFLEGVVLSGGEPTLHATLPAYARAIKALGYQIKLDTNGTRPAMIKQLLDEGLVDYVALDFKAPHLRWHATTGRDTGGFFALMESLDHLQMAPVDYEIRTTYHPDQLTLKDLKAILSTLDQIGIDKPLFVQHYRHSHTIGQLQACQRPDLSALEGAIIER
jgi:pyruvate formate lyase activating enzyme